MNFIQYFFPISETQEVLLMAGCNALLISSIRPNDFMQSHKECGEGCTSFHEIV
jgi:hypothetical protein